MPKSKKYIAFILSIIFIAYTPFSAFATNIISKEASEALSFAESKNLLIGEVISTTKTNEGYLFGLKYLPSGEISYLTYKKLPNNDIELTVIEGERSNTLLFKEDSTVYVDGEITTAFDSPVNAGYAAYTNTYSTRNTWAVYHTNTLPTGFTDDGFTIAAGNVTPVTLALPIAFESITATVLASTIITGLGWINATGVATTIASALISVGFAGKTLLYRASVTRSNEQYPLQIAYKYTETWRDAGVQEWPYFTYRIETLL